MLQSSGSVCSAESNPDTLLDELVESDADYCILVHTADTNYTSVDVFHAYCALAVVKHRLSDWQCTLNCCKDAQSACDVAGLCRLLLWNVDMNRRRCAEELQYIHQLQTTLSINRDLSSVNANEPTGQQSSLPYKESDDSGADDVNLDTSASDKLSSETSHFEPSSLMKPDLVDECGATAADNAEVNVINDVERASPLVQQCSDWQTLPLDVKYAECELSVQLLQQEADRLQHLYDGYSHCMVITFN